MAMRKSLPTQETLQTVFDYNPDTGVFLWKTGQRTGLPAGSLDKAGYIRIRLNRYEQYKAHRLAWVYMYGSINPETLTIDHINHNRADNRLANLRIATQQQNAHNTLQGMNSGLTLALIKQVPTGYRVQISGKTKTFPTKDQALLYRTQICKALDLLEFLPTELG